MKQQFYRVARSKNGIYVLIDYLNFKGAGLNPREVSNEHRWGLLQVMLDMPDTVTQENVTKAFTISAAKTLIILIQNSAPNYRQIRFLHGWMRRLSSYANESLFSE